MRSGAARQDRLLLFRTYLIIVGGLILTGLLLDLGLSRLSRTEDTVAAALAESALKQVESRLDGVGANEWPAAAVRLGRELGYEVRILPVEHVVGDRDGQRVQEVYDAAGRTWFLRDAKDLGAHLQIGPFDSGAESDLAKWIPPLFYLSVFVLVGIWLWPLMRDLNLISQSARQFAADYRKPIRTAQKTTALQGLASNLDEMSAQIHGLIQKQKELTSALSHEMRTPLTRIKFAMAVMEDKRAVADELESIGQDVEEIDKLIATMIDYTRLDHPGTELDWELTPIGPWLHECADKARGLGATIEIENFVDDAVRMDPRLMGLALSNLLVNACRYAKERVVVSASKGSKKIILQVDDDGPGIPESRRKSVFDAFTRLDDSRSKHTGGYGLGLAIVARVANLHSGVAAVGESALGGTRMTITWPSE